MGGKNVKKRKSKGRGSRVKKRFGHVLFFARHSLGRPQTEKKMPCVCVI